MAEPINLRRARKAKMRAEKERAAEANRAKFGRTGAEKDLANTEKARTNRALDGARREAEKDCR